VSDSLLTPDPDSPSETHPTRSRHRVLKVAAWIVGGIATLLFVVVITVAILLNSTGFHDYVIRTAETQAHDSLGVRVQLQNYSLHLSNLSLDLYGVTVDGASPYQNPPLLQVQHVNVGVRVVSILHRKWYLDNFQVDQPVVQVVVDKSGVSNIPTIKSSNSSSNTSIFDLGVRHASLNRGEVFCNSRPASINADLHNVDFQASFDDSLKKYSGHLQYADGNVLYGTFHPFQHDFEARFDATPATFHLTPARISGAGSQIVLTATVNNYSNPSVQAHYDITVDGAQLGKILDSPSVPAGIVLASGDAQYQAVPNRALLDTVIVNGTLSSRDLAVKTPSIRAAIDNIAAHYSLQNGNAILHDFRASLLGGELTAQGTIKDLAGNSHSDFKASLHGVSLAAARSLAGPSASTPGVAITGALNADATASWGKTLDNLEAHADATIKGLASGTKPAPAPPAGATSVSLNRTPVSIPVDSAIHATYTGSDQQLSLTQSYLRTPQTTLTMNGTVSKRSSLALHLQANDLQEIATLANLFAAPSAGEPAQPLNLSGAATFQGTVQGSTSVPHLTGQLSASNLQFNGTTVKILRTNVDLSPSQASLQHADLEPAGHGRITFNASTGLTRWSFTRNSPIQIDLDATQMNIADLTKLAGQQIPVTGALNAHISAHGTEQSPIGSGNVSLTKLVAYDEPITSVNLTFAGTGEDAHADLAVDLPAGSVRGKVSVRPKDRTYIAQLTSAGIQLNKVQQLKAKNVDAAGVLAIDASGQGSFDNPQLYATLQIPTLTIQKQTVNAIKLQANLANHIANATLSSTAVNTSIQAKAQVNLTGDYPADATLDTQGIPLQPLLAVYAPEQAPSVSGETELHATLHGPLKNKNLLEAHATIPYLRVSYNNSIQLAAASPIRADYKNGVLEVQRSSIRGTDTDLQFQGSIPTTGNAPMSVLLQGSVNLQLAQLFDPDVRTSGQLKFNINSYGKSDASNIGGEIDVVDASYASADLPVGLEHGNGVLTLTSDRININKFQGTVGGGTVTAQGGVAYRPGLQFDLGLAAHDIRILYPQGMRESVDANLRFAGTSDNATLGGSVNLSDLSFTPAFDLTSFISQVSGGVVSPPSQGFSQNIQLNLSVRSTNNVNLVSRELSVNGDANLQVRGTAADPVILGRVNLNSGDMILNGDRFVLNGGTVQFINPSETQPVVNVTLSTSIQQYNINLRFNGPANQLTTQYSSDPALPSADIIHLLAFGSTTEATSTTTPESVVASQVSSQVTSRLSKIAGISQLSINPVLAGSNSQGPAGANITIQQRVTGNLFITFSSNVASTQSQTIQGQYQVSPRVAVSATRDPNGGFAMDALIKKSW
jgi:translocation and assembly module TamB